MLMLPPALALLAAVTGAAALTLRNQPAGHGHNDDASSVLAEDLDLQEDAERGFDRELEHFLQPSKDLPQLFPLLLAQERNRSVNESKRDATEIEVVSRKYNNGKKFKGKINNTFWPDEAPHGPIKLVVWSAVMAYMKEIPKAHMDTWMQQPGVCNIKRHDDPDCHIFPVWVYGNISQERRKEAILAAGDLVTPLFGDHIPEPPEREELAPCARTDCKMNVGGYSGEGKSLAMKRNLNLKTPFATMYAKDNFRWATHLARMDLDTFPFFSQIFEDLEALPRDNVFYGSRTRNHTTCDFGLTTGEFSLVSTNLLDCWAEQESHKETRSPDRGKWKYPYEDLIFSEIMFDAQKSGRCPDLVCVDVRIAKRFKHPVR